MMLNGGGCDAGRGGCVLMLMLLLLVQLVLLFGHFER